MGRGTGRAASTLRVSLASYSDLVFGRKVVLDILFPFVTEQSDDRLELGVNLPDLSGSDEVGAAGRANEEAVFFGQEPHVLDGLFGVHGEGGVHQPLVALENARDEAVGDALYEVVPDFPAQDGR